MEFDINKQVYGRTVLKTSHIPTGDIVKDISVVKGILKDVLPTHQKNAEEETKLFDILVNAEEWWCKTKVTRSDINNNVRIPTAWALSRTINSYCFGEPVKYVSRNSTSENDINSKQDKIEKLSAYLDYAHNHDAFVMATFCSSCCGLGYKLCLPATEEEIKETGVPFVINDEMIFPQFAGVVKSNEIIGNDVLGFIKGTYYNEKGEPDGFKYTCWTKYAKYVLREKGNDFEIVPQIMPDGTKVDYYPLISKHIPLIEYERNPFRKGDWEIATDLLKLKNNLISNRMDDIQQAVDYLLVLVNCTFEDDSEKKDIIQSRIIELKNVDPNNPQKVEFLNNVLDQSAVQELQEYVDLCIQECVGIPNRQERGGGGGDTGMAVKYRNGYRDLENNAGLIIAKADKAEMKFLSVCLGYCENSSLRNELANLKAYDVRLKFLHSFTDDPLSSSQAFSNYVNAGMDYVNALLCSRTGTDPSEISKKILEANEKGETYLKIKEKIESITAGTVVENTDNYTE